MASINIVELVKKNKFGAKTYWIQIDTLHRVEINEANNGTYIIEFFERGIVWPTHLYSFTSNDDIIEVISQSMDKVADYFRQSPKYNVPEHLHTKDKREAMAIAHNLFKR